MAGQQTHKDATLVCPRAVWDAWPLTCPPYRLIVWSCRQALDVRFGHPSGQLFLLDRSFSRSLEQTSSMASHTELERMKKDCLHYAGGRLVLGPGVAGLKLECENKPWVYYLKTCPHSSIVSRFTQKDHCCGCFTSQRGMKCWELKGSIFWVDTWVCPHSAPIMVRSCWVSV